EAVPPAQVVVVLQHAHQRGLAEAPRPQENHVPVAGLQHREERRLVRIEEPLRPDLPEVADAVGDLHAAAGREATTGQASPEGKAPPTSFRRGASVTYAGPSEPMTTADRAVDLGIAVERVVEVHAKAGERAPSRPWQRPA